VAQWPPARLSVPFHPHRASLALVFDNFLDRNHSGSTLYGMKRTPVAGQFILLRASCLAGRSTAAGKQVETLRAARANPSMRLKERLAKVNHVIKKESK
jgi:hypothetical protein